ncbi:hypothetical protein [Pedobacter sp.]|uniref:hypothetical protein n=1 Tax=Pedobacter sp. TaxID=1411316 RepID=UPI003C6560BC
METKNFYCWVGLVSVSIGDVFEWNGVGRGTYKVVGWGETSGIYSPSGLGGTNGVMVQKENGEIEEWCGDSVASGIHQGRLKP